MKKFYTLFLLMLVASFAIAQYASKLDAKRGIVSPKQASIAKQTTSKAIQTTYLSEGFEGIDITTSGWIAIDQDGDGNGWDISTAGFHSGLQCATSSSWDVTALTPENWLISPAIDLTTATGTLFLDWWVRAQDQSWPAEHYKVMLSTTDEQLTSFTTNLYEETVTTGPASTNNYLNRTANVSAYAGQTIYVAFVHYNCTDMFRLNFDDISVYDVTATDAGAIAISAPNNVADCQLNSSENVTVRIMNYGGTAISNFPVSYKINNGAAVTENCTQSINPAAYYDYTFTATADMNALGIYNIVAYTEVSGDVNAANDSDTTFVYNADAHITVTTHTDSTGGAGTMGWYVLNSSTGDTVAKRSGYQWNVDATDEICVFSDSCYQAVFYDTDGFMDTYAWAAIYYNGNLVAGSTTPGSYTTSPISAGNLCTTSVKGLTTNNKSDISIYPNPVNNILSIDNAASATIAIYDIIGQQINVKTNVSDHVTFDMSSLADGNYFVKIQSDKNVVTKKINLVK